MTITAPFEALEAAAAVVRRLIVGQVIVDLPFVVESVEVSYEAHGTIVDERILGQVVDDLYQGLVEKS